MTSAPSQQCMFSKILYEFQRIRWLFVVLQSHVDPPWTRCYWRRWWSWQSLSHLKYLQAHNALVLLKNSLSMPRLLYTLRTSDCRNHPLLTRFDTILREGLLLILNVNFYDTQWLQATLPVRNGGIGLRTTSTLATSAFLASAASTEAFQQAFLPPSHSNAADKTRNLTVDAWISLSSSASHEPCFQRIQKAWNGPVVKSVMDRIALSANSDVDHAILKVATAPHSGDWLHAAPIASVGLKLMDKEIRISVAKRLRVWTCTPHTCICGKLADARGLHGLSCRKSTPRHQRHAMLTDIIWRAIKRAEIPANRNQQDSSQVVINAQMEPLWSRGRKANRSHGTSPFLIPSLTRTSIWHHRKQELQLDKRHRRRTPTTLTSPLLIFYPIAIETACSWDVQALEVIEEIGRWVTEATEDPKETMYLFQRLSMAIQRGNALSFFNTVDKNHV